MKTTHLIKTLRHGALVAGMLAFSSSINATPVTSTQLIHFDDANNGDAWYSDADNNFLFDPTNLQSSTLCADSTNGGNGSCVIEGKGGQNLLPKMTRPQYGPDVDTENGPGVTLEPSQGSPNDDPITSGNLLTFDLDSFYFLLTGKGNTLDNLAGNFLEVTGTWADTTTETAKFELGQSYTNVTDYDGGGNADGTLVWNNGYIASFDTLFDGVTSIQWTASDSAQIRLDCVVATFDGTTSEPLSSFNSGCGSTSVPEPSILALLSIGLFGIGAVRKLKKH